MCWVQVEGGGVAYMDSHLVLPTSIVCERLFFQTGGAIGSNRCGIGTDSFESQILLHCNMDLWGLLDVNKIVN